MARRDQSYWFMFTTCAPHKVHVGVAGEIHEIPSEDEMKRDGRLFFRRLMSKVLTVERKTRV